MASPSHTIIHPRLGAALLGFLPLRVTLESPRKGGGWDLEAAHVPARIEDKLHAATDPQGGGLLMVQTTILRVLATVTIADAWRITREDTGVAYLCGPPVASTDAPLLDVELTRGV